MSARIDIVGVTKTYDGNTRAVDAVDMSIGRENSSRCWGLRGAARRRRFE